METFVNYAGREYLLKGSDEWTWVTGYKGTEKDMTCRGYQYEMNKQFDIPENETVAVCSNGFHLCGKLHDVFKYYDVYADHRFFEVSALVRKEDLESFGKKLAAKSIVFTRELDVDEILRTYLERVFKMSHDHWQYCDEEFDFKNWSDESKHGAISYGVKATLNNIAINNLMALGYSRPFANYVTQNMAYSVAKAVGSQSDLSMDMKAMYIFDAIQRIASTYTDKVSYRRHR